MEFQTVSNDFGIQGPERGFEKGGLARALDP